MEMDGTIYYPDMVLGESRQGLKLSYFTDTRPFHGLTDFVKIATFLLQKACMLTMRKLIRL